MAQINKNMMNKLLSLTIILLIHFDSISQNVDFMDTNIKSVIVIPARIDSKRLPKKILKIDV